MSEGPLPGPPRTPHIGASRPSKSGQVNDRKGSILPVGVQVNKRTLASGFGKQTFGTGEMSPKGSLAQSRLGDAGNKHYRKLCSILATTLGGWQIVRKTCRETKSTGAARLGTEDRGAAS